MHESIPIWNIDHDGLFKLLRCDIVNCENKFKLQEVVNRFMITEWSVPIFVGRNFVDTGIIQKVHQRRWHQPWL